jgi:hypothetical protein
MSLGHRAKNTGVAVSVSIVMKLLMQGGARRGKCQKGHDRDQQRGQSRLAKAIHAFSKPLHNLPIIPLLTVSAISNY